MDCCQPGVKSPVSRDLLKGVKIVTRLTKTSGRLRPDGPITTRARLTRHKSSTSRKQPSAGFALTITYRFIYQPQGWLGVKNHPDVPTYHLRLGSVRAHGLSEDMDEAGGRDVFGRLLYVSIFWALCRPTGGRQGTQTFLEFPRCNAARAQP